MRIGVMLRDIGNQEDAPGIIVLNLLDQILEQDTQNRYVLFFRNQAFTERYRALDHVEIVQLPARSRFLWDQVAVPLAARRAKLDLLFHPKHSLPLLTGLKTVMHLRGPEYWIHPRSYELLDLLYQRTFLHLFSRKATHLIAESRYAQREFQRYLSIPEPKISTIHIAAADRFKPVEDPGELESAARRFGLPKRFVFTVTRVVQGKKFYPGKNIFNTIEAYLQSEAAKTMPFVIAGRETRTFVEQHAAARGWPAERLLALDAVPQQDLPALYTLAEVFLFPSKNESFGIPILEAMKCRCPVITANSSACPEIAGDAAILVDPDSPKAIAEAIDRIVTDPDLRIKLIEQGTNQAEKFRWSTAARKTIELFNALA